MHQSVAKLYDSIALLLAFANKICPLGQAFDQFIFSNAQGLSRSLPRGGMLMAGIDLPII